MNIDKVKVKPKLVEVTLAADTLVKEYGEPIKFFMMDHLEIQTYFDFFKAHSEQNFDKLVNIVKTIILNDKGERVIKEDETLPMDIFTEAVIAIGETLGKSKTKS